MIPLLRDGQSWVTNYTRSWPVTGVAYPLWRARRGTKLHRIKTARVYINQGKRMAVTWWCGNMTSDPVPFRPECDEGWEPCRVCQAKGGDR